MQRQQRVLSEGSSQLQRAGHQCCWHCRHGQVRTSKGGATSEEALSHHTHCWPCADEVPAPPSPLHSASSDRAQGHIHNCHLVGASCPVRSAKLACFASLLHTEVPCVLDCSAKLNMSAICSIACGEAMQDRDRRVLGVEDD